MRRKLQNSSARCRALCPRRAPSGGSSRICASSFASAAASPVRNATPLEPSTSRNAPRSDVITGRPRNMFSATTKPKTSPPKEGTTTTDARASSDAPSKRRFLRETFKGGTLRPVADDEQLERSILRKQDARSVQQDPNALCIDQPALKRHNRNLRKCCSMLERLGNKFQAVRDRNNSRKLEQPAEPRRRSNVDRNPLTQETAHERQQPKLARSNPSLAGIAPKAFAMPVCHKVSRTWRRSRLDQKLAVRANRLKPVMLNNDWLAAKKAENDRRQRRARHMNDIGSSDQIPKLNDTWLTDNTKRQRPIVKFPRGRLRSESDLEFRPLLRCA